MVGVGDRAWSTVGSVVGQAVLTDETPGRCEEEAMASAGTVELLEGKVALLLVDEHVDTGMMEH